MPAVGYVLPSSLSPEPAAVTKRDEFAARNVALLIERFDQFVDEYDRRNPFDRSDQRTRHVRTLELRAEAGTAAAALNSEVFLGSLYNTLKAWGIGVRGSHLVPQNEFVAALRIHEAEITALDGKQIDDPALRATEVTRALWTLIANLGIVDNDAPLVAGSKALHHVLPDLVSPIDRQYTRPFFGWYSNQFQYSQERAFAEIFATFWRIAVRVQPERLVASGWRTSKAKILDNAVVAFCLVEEITKS